MPHSFRLMVEQDQGTGPDCQGNIIFASHLEGANGSTTLISDGIVGGTIEGDAVISTADFVTSPSSIFIPNTPNSLLRMNNYDQPINNQFTVQLWFKFTGVLNSTDSGGVLTLGGNNIYIYKALTTPRTLRVVAGGGGSVVLEDYREQVWIHIAVEVDGVANTAITYVDGIKKHTKTGYTVDNEILNMVFGDQGGNALDGYIDEPMVIQELLYNGNDFVPSTEPYIPC